MATTTTKAPTIPALTSDPAYAKALAKRDEIETVLLGLRLHLRRLEAEYSAASVAASGPAANDHDRAVNAFLADLGNGEAEEIDTRANLFEEIANVRGKVEIVSDALGKHDQTDVAPAKAAAQRKLAPVVFEQTWKPTMRKAIELMIGFHRQWADVLTLAEQVAAAGLWVSPLTHPIDYPKASAKDHLDSAARIVGAGVEQGYFTASEARALLPGLKL